MTVNSTIPPLAEGQLRRTARRLGLGRLLWLSYHMPIGAIRTSIRFGGPVEQWRTERGRREMERAAERLPPFAPVPGQRISPRAVHFVTGRRHWYQTLFCAYSLQLHADIGMPVVVYDDGTLQDDQAERMRRALPLLRVESSAAIEARLDRYLPAAVYPTLRRHRLVYPHLRKLTDVHAGAAAWTLVLDSDMLFFKRPDFVLDWLASPTQPCHLLDAVPAYGYSDRLMRDLANAPIPPLLNVGLCGLDSGTIDWQRLEAWCRALLEREGPGYYLEQALTAMLVAGQDRAVAPRDKYVVLPDLTEGMRQTAILHHYVAESKRSYFQHGWRSIASLASATTSSGRL